jgi:uncharacterized protein (TIGR02099 family)
LSAILPLVQRSGFLFRFLALFLLVLVVGIGLLHLILRYWLLPDIEHYRNDIAYAITQAAGQRVTIESISAHWDGIHPHLILRKVQVHDKEGRPALILNRLESIPSWRSLLSGELRFREIKIDQPNLTVYRDSNGVLHVAGITLGRDQDASQSGFLNWLLYQRHVDVVNARIFWKDEKRGAPLLELKAVSLHLENHSNNDLHRFWLRATPPAKLASPLDIRGDFTGEQLNIPEQWHGQLFVKLNYADIAAWQSWFPVLKTTEINRGTGAIGMWINIDKGNIKQLTADIRLKNVKTRLTHELPELDLVFLRGRVGWKRINSKAGKGSELFAHQLEASIRGKRILQPADFLLQDVMAHDGGQRSGKLSTKSLDLETLGGLVEYLPIDESIRDQFNKLLPHGEIHSMQAEWDGLWSDPVNLSVKGKFNNIGMNSSKSLPAFRGVSGNIDTDEKGGTLNINSQKISFDLPDLFRKPMMFDTFTGNISWGPLNDNDFIKIKFNNISFGNDHVSGGVHGTYHTEHDGPGEIDLVGHLTRGDASFVGHYLPILDKFPHEWLSSSIVSGELSDVKLRLKGRLASFPFRNNEHGIFQISMKAANGVLDYVPGWPKIEDISANLLFQGSSMEINASQASTSDTKLSKIKVQIADMMASDVRLQINGVASGATKQFIKFYDEHIVDIFAHDLIDSFNIIGNGELLLNLTIPLPYSDDIKVSGNYLFNNNRIDTGGHMPNLEKINGVLGFTESTIETEKIRAQILGGAVTINSTVSQDDGISLAVVGKINLDNLLQLNQGRPTDATRFWTKHIRGSTDWSAVVKIHDKIGDKRANVLIKSSLQGIALDFPEPLSKIAADVVPLRFERNITDLMPNFIKINYGKQVAAKIVFSYDDSGNYHTEQGLIQVGTGSSKLPESGMLLAGELPKLQLDKWRGLFDQFNSLKMSGKASKVHLDLSEIYLSKIDLHTGVLDFLGRRFNDLTLNANFINGEWYSAILSKEISGKVNWYSQNQGKVVGRFKKFTVPAVYPIEPPAVKKQQSEKSLPALDILVDKFVISRKNLGRLKLIAMQKEEGWSIEELYIANQDSSFIADGIWKNRSVSPRIDMNIKLEASDLNKFLTRFGYPDRIKRGSGSLDGHLSWLGRPQAISYKTLSGKVNIQARNGQFPKFELGIGKLFGIFDLKSIPRRVTLDFRDVYADGFGFDKLAGSASIIEGIMSTDNLRIGGPAADVKMDGEVNLISETYNLHFIVTPSLGLASPVVDIATIIANKAKKGSIKPHEYNITGTWEDPVVTRLH